MAETWEQPMGRSWSARMAASGWTMRKSRGVHRIYPCQPCGQVGGRAVRISSNANFHQRRIDGFHPSPSQIVTKESPVHSRFLVIPWGNLPEITHNFPKRHPKNSSTGSSALQTVMRKAQERTIETAEFRRFVKNSESAVRSTMLKSSVSATWRLG